MCEEFGVFLHVSDCSTTFEFSFKFEIKHTRLRRNLNKGLLILKEMNWEIEDPEERIRKFSAKVSRAKWQGGFIFTKCKLFNRYNLAMFHWLQADVWEYQIERFDGIQRKHLDLAFTHKSAVSCECCYTKPHVLW